MDQDNVMSHYETIRANRETAPLGVKLCWVCSNPKFDEVSDLVIQGADVNTTTESWSSSDGMLDGLPPIMIATTAWLYDNGALDVQNHEEQLAILRYLIDKGARTSTLRLHPANKGKWPSLIREIDPEYVVDGYFLMSKWLHNECVRAERTDIASLFG